MNTAQDLTAYLLSSTGGGAQDGEHAAVRQSIIHGYREVIQCKDWRWFLRDGHFATKTVETVCSFNKGSNQVRVANADECLPGRLIEISGTYFPHPVRITEVSGDVLTVNSKALDSASGVKARPAVYYDLPLDLKDIDTLSTATVGTLHCYIPPQEWLHLEVNTRGTGEPYYYTIMRSDKNPDRYQVRFVGIPNDIDTVHFTYRKLPRPIKYLGYERITRDGTVAMASDGTQMLVTGTKTQFPQDVAGSYIRFGSPGMEADPIGSTVPFIMERRIERWHSATSLTVSDTTIYDRPGPDGKPISASNFDAGIVATPLPFEPAVEGDNDDPYETILHSNINTPIPAGTRYAITDVVDASPQMYTAILSACEMWYARVAGKDAGVAMQAFNRDLRIAMECDAIVPEAGKPNHRPYPTARTMGWRSMQLPDLS